MIILSTKLVKRGNKGKEIPFLDALFNFNIFTLEILGECEINERYDR